jgi:glycosyltransferase involved in cell wall biosynthesis
VFFRQTIPSSRRTDRPLKICIIAGESRATAGGLSAYARVLARELRSQGVEIATVARFDRPEAGPMDYAARATNDATPIDGIPTNLVHPAFGWTPLLRQLHHMTDRPALRGLPPRIFTRAFARSLERAMPSECDIVHYVGAGRELLSFAALKAARARRAAFTILPAVHAKSWADSPLDIDLYKQSNAVLCQSQHEIDHLQSLGVPSTRLLQVWLAPAASPDGNARAFRDAHHLGDRPMILFIGRRTRAKGFHAVCEAMPQVLAQIPNACLVAIGPSVEAPYPAVPEQAYLDIGTATEADKANALAACDVFCMPSTTEAFGIVYVEAWSYAKPVIGGMAPAVRELIKDGEAGYCVDQNPRALAANLAMLLTDPALRTRLGAAGRELQQSRYNWPAVTQLHLDIFHSLLAQESKSLAPSCAY